MSVWQTFPLRDSSCFLGLVCGHADSFDPLNFSDPVFCWSTNAADHSLDLVPESLIHQSVHNWVDSGIEHDQYMSSSMCCIIDVIIGNISGEDVAC